MSETLVFHILEQSLKFMKELKPLVMVEERRWLFLTLLGLREYSLLSKHMAGCKMRPAGPVGRSGTAVRNPEMKMQRLPGAGREKCLSECISMMVHSRVE